MVDFADTMAEIIQAENASMQLPPLPVARRASLKKTIQEGFTTKGGQGSGNFGHAGRPGEVGGSRTEDLTESPYSSSDNLAKTFFEARSIYDEAIKAGKEHYQAHFKTMEFITNNLSNYRLSEYLSGKMEINYRDSWCGSTKKYTSASDSQRAQVKKAGIEKLFKEMKGEVSRETIGQYFKAWTWSANDHNTASLSLQEAASQEFGFELSDWQKESLKETSRNQEIVNELNLDAIPKADPSGKNWDQVTKLAKEEVVRVANKLKVSGMQVDQIIGILRSQDPNTGLLKPIADRATERKLLRATYDITQRELKKAGYGPDSYVTLFRGMDFDAGDTKAGNKIIYKGNALESWSDDVFSAEIFT